MGVLAQLAPPLKLWGVAAGGGYKAWHECHTARQTQGALAQLAPPLKLWGVTAGGGITLGTNAAPQGVWLVEIYGFGYLWTSSRGHKPREVYPLFSLPVVPPRHHGHGVAWAEILPDALQDREDKMALYETVIIVRQEARAEGVASLAKIYSEILEKNNGTVPRWESWGLRTLAFPIRKNLKAHYFMLCIDAPHSAIAEMESRLRYDDKVLRYMTVRVKEHSSEDSAMVPAPL